MRRLALLPLIAALTFYAPAHAEEEATPEAQLAALLAPTCAQHDVPALAVAIVSSNGPAVVAVSGVRKRGADTAVTPADLWHIGSCTKSMTATLIGRLVDQKKLRFETTVAQAFPDLAESMHASWRDVTLDLLLRNRGGAPATLDRDGLWAHLWQHTGTPREARRLLAKTMLAWPPAYEPGTQYEYSNAGFALVGHAAECLLDQPYEALITAELFEPLGIQTAGFGAPGSADKLDQPWGHRLLPQARPPVPPGPPADNPPAIAPAGRVHLSMADWARYAQLHLAGAREGDEKLAVERGTLRHIQTPRRGEDYALGWGTTTRPWANGPVLSHTGSNTMWFSVLWLAPRKDFAVLVACNQGGDPGAQATDAVASAAIRWHLERQAKPR
ncbi:MAG: serine hydrolase [Planctomycetota bacterium]|nr:serine hydrolase [Planctomycetota bacterium]